MKIILKYIFSPGCGQAVDFFSRGPARAKNVVIGRFSQDKRGKNGKGKQEHEKRQIIPWTTKSSWRGSSWPYYVRIRLIGRSGMCLN